MSDASAIKALQYLEANELLKKTLIEGISEHIPSLARIIDTAHDEEIKKINQTYKSFVSWWANMVHTQYHNGESRFFKDCTDPICKSAFQTIEELS